MKLFLLVVILLFSNQSMSQALGNGISDEKYLACANIGYIGSDIEACLFSNASVEKINLCGAIGYDNAGGVNRCINSNATIEKIQACRSIGFGFASPMNRCIESNASVEKMVACVQTHVYTRDSINDCFTSKASIERISKCQNKYKDKQYYERLEKTQKCIKRKFLVF